MSQGAKWASVKDVQELSPSGEHTAVTQSMEERAGAPGWKQVLGTFEPK